MTITVRMAIVAITAITDIRAIRPLQLVLTLEPIVVNTTTTVDREMNMLQPSQYLWALQRLLSSEPIQPLHAFLALSPLQ